MSIPTSGEYLRSMRAQKPWNVPTKTRECGTRASIRSRISPAALLVKVKARIWSAPDTRVEEMSDAAGDDPRLAGTRARQDQKRTFDVGHGLELRGRQISEQFHY